MNIELLRVENNLIKNSRIVKFVEAIPREAWRLCQIGVYSMKEREIAVRLHVNREQLSDELNKWLKKQSK